MIDLNKELFDWLVMRPKEIKMRKAYGLYIPPNLRETSFADVMEESNPFRDPETFGLDYNPYVEQDIP